jgi:hypothetical protein
MSFVIQSVFAENADLLPFPASDNEKPQHPPDKEKCHDRCKHMANPLARSVRSAETKHPAIVPPRCPYYSRNAQDRQGRIICLASARELIPSS